MKRKEKLFAEDDIKRIALPDQYLRNSSAQVGIC